MSPRRSAKSAKPATAAPAAARPAQAAPAVPPRPDVERIVDPRAVRVTLAAGAAAVHPGIATLVIEPPAVPLAPVPRFAGGGVLGGIAAPPSGFGSSAHGLASVVIVDGEPADIGLERSDPVHAVLVEGRAAPVRTRVLLLPFDGPSAAGSAGATRPHALDVRRREIVVDGWRVEVEIESERRASLRERARRGREETAHGGPTEVHAIIPGKVVSVSVVPGDAVVAGQQLLVVEAMKMQNELRAPRDGVISKVAVGVDRTIEVGDLLLVLE